MQVARALAVLPLAVAAACTETVRPPATFEAVETVRTATPVLSAPPPRVEGAAVAKATSAEAVEPVPPAHAMELFGRHCAGCHGDAGLGDGPAATRIDPHPWNFSGALFKLGTTVNGSASDADLRRTIEGGIVGTAMPGFARLAPEDLDELVRAVRHLALVATAERIESADAGYSRAEVLEVARRLVAPGQPIVLPPRPEVESQALDVQYAFAQRCVECHGDDGAGRGAEGGVLYDEFRFVTHPRDLTRDPLKGGSSPDDLARRLIRGMPGTPMPAAMLSGPGLWAAVAMVMRLREKAPPPPPPDAPLVVATCARDLPSAPGDPAWTAVPAARWSLRPLRAKTGAPDAVEVRALRLGARIAVRVDWSSPLTGRSGAAIRFDRTGGYGFALADTAGTRRGTGRWETFAASVPAADGFVPPPEWPEAERGFSGSGSCADGRTSVVFVGDLPPEAVASGSADITVTAWTGTAADGRALAGFSDEQPVGLPR